MSGPPRLTQSIVRALLPRELREEALDELNDLHSHYCARDGRASADAWYWRSAPGYVLRLRFATLTGGPLVRQPSVARRDWRELMHSILTDLRYGFRAMRRNPLFTS